MNKGLEAFNNFKDYVSWKLKLPQKQCFNITEIEKELKALEVIKEHTLYCENVDCFVFVNITKEVNDLLKEVLL